MGKEEKKYSGKGKLRKGRADEEKRRSLGGNSTKNNGRSKRKGEGGKKEKDRRI